MIGPEDDDVDNRHLLDLATAAGADTGRYILVVEPGTESVPAKGPRFGDDASLTDDPDLQWVQLWIDNCLDQQDKQR
jgi:hypothetical protein